MEGDIMAKSDDTLTFWQKAAYAIGDLGFSVGPGTIIPFWYSFFLTDIVRMDLRLVGLFWMIATAWDAINDPLFGFLSDRTRTRWGRRRPYILFGAVPFGVTFALLWTMPQFDRPLLQFAYYIGIYILYEAAFTAASCPYVALTPELTQDHDERTELVTYRMAVSIAAGLLAPLVIGLVIFPMFPPRAPAAYRTIGFVSGMTFIPPLLIAFAGTRERDVFRRAAPPPIKETIGYVFRNRVFRSIVALRLLSWVPVMIVQAVFAYYLIYWTGMTEDETSLVQGAILAAAFLFLPLVVYLSKRMEKQRAYVIAMESWAIVMAAIFWVPRGAKFPVYILGALAGFGVSAAHVLPQAMSPDALEVDELMSGTRQEGAYAGVMVFVDKLARMIALSTLPLVLRWADYVQPTDAEPLPAQPDSALLALRVLVSFAPAALLLLSVPVARAHPMTRARHREITAELAARRGDPGA
jgi:glycoside/pentoside/hexuronide:cation symporter, GPH family